MTTYRKPADAEIDHKSPGTETLFAALRDNPIAIAEGADGAPRIKYGAHSLTATSVSVVTGASPSVVYLALGPALFGTPSVGIVPSGCSVGFGSNAAADIDNPMLRINMDSGSSTTITAEWYKVDS